MILRMNRLLFEIYSKINRPYIQLAFADNPHIFALTPLVLPLHPFVSYSKLKNVEIKYSQMYMNEKYSQMYEHLQFG